MIYLSFLRACVNSDPFYSYINASNASSVLITGLPAGVTGAWAGNVATISGTPTVSGTFNYTVTTTGGCPTAITTGTIIVNPISTSVTNITIDTEIKNDTGITEDTYVTINALNFKIDQDVFKSSATIKNLKFHFVICTNL